MFFKPVKAQLIEKNTATENKIAVPFLLLSTDAITSGLGEAGTALQNNNFSANSNTALTGLQEERFKANVTYTPWLRKLVNDRKLIYFGGSYKLNPKLAIVGALNYLSYGQVDLIDINQVNLGSIKPTEYVASIGIAKSFSNRFALGMKMKFIHSNLYSGAGSEVWNQNGTAYAVDISSFHNYPLPSFANNSSLSLAIVVENIGPKISYFNQPDQKSFLPSNLKIGTAYKTEIDPDNEFGLALDFNKLLIPSALDTQDLSVMESIFKSFNSAKIGLSFGAEYNYKSTVSFRLGYNLQGDKRTQGNFFAFGAGFIYKKLNINMAYITGDPQDSFLSNTLRIGLGYSIL